jgi:rod shape-determining protein MreD
MADSIAIMRARPDIILIALVYVALSSGTMTGMVLGFTVGLLQDFYGPPVNLGLNALCKSLLGFGFGYGKEGLYKDNPFILTGVLVLAVISHDLIYFLIDTKFNMDLFFTMLWSRSLPSALYTGFLSIVLILAIAHRRGRFNARRLFT